MRKQLKTIASCPSSRMAIAFGILVVCAVLMVTAMFVLGCLEGHGVLMVDKRLTVWLGKVLHGVYGVVATMGMAAAAAPFVWLARRKVAEALLAAKWLFAAIVILGGLVLLSAPMAFVVELDIDAAKIAIGGSSEDGKLRNAILRK